MEVTEPSSTMSQTKARKVTWKTGRGLVYRKSN